ncbi:MAG: hypothetical protein IH600_16420 [Bacteroidetes bacterium]|nr:hypothetical protein [Bacteroidota bacterium]
MDLAPYSMVPGMIGGLAGAVGAFAKDPEFDRHGTDHFWRDHYKEQFAGAYEDARTDPYRGNFFRNANRSHLTATNAMLENSANLRARQANNTGMMFGGGYSRDLASMAPGFYAQQAGNLAQGYAIRDRNIQAENAFVGHNTDAQQDLFVKEVQMGTHRDYNKGLNLVNKVAGGAVEGASLADGLYNTMWTRGVNRDLLANEYGQWTENAPPVPDVPITDPNGEDGLPYDYGLPPIASQNATVGRRTLGLQPTPEEAWAPGGQFARGGMFNWGSGTLSPSYSGPIRPNVTPRMKSMFNNPYRRSPLTPYRQL